MNPTYLEVIHDGPQEKSSEVKRKTMKKMYRCVEEKIPCNVPQSRGKSNQINVHVNTDHTSNKVTRKS